MRAALAGVAACFLFLSYALAQSVSGGGFSAPLPINSVLVDDGDSSYATNGSSDGMTWLSYAVPKSGRSFRFYNTSLAGETCATMYANFSTNITPLYSSSLSVFLNSFLAGANDIRGGASAATVYTCFQNYIAAVHALGSNAKVMVPTYPLQCDIFDSGTWLPILQTLNNLVYANWNVPQASGGLGADALVDYFAQPTVGMNTYSSSAYCSATYSPDGQHFNDLGKSIIGQVQSPVIAQFMRF